MKNYLKAGVNLVGQGLLELMHVIFILAIGVLTYYLVRNLPIDHMIAIALSIGTGLLAAYGIYGAKNVVDLASMSASNSDQYPFENDSESLSKYDHSDDLFRNMNPVYSNEINNIYNGEDKE